jgi:hypothetical protein
MLDAATAPLARKTIRPAPLCTARATSPRGRAGTMALAALFALLALPVAAQRRPPREAPPPPPIPFEAAVQWTVFVSAHGDQPSRRTVASAEPGAIPLPIEGWSCSYSAPTRARVDDTNWSEVRTLECVHQGASVSTTGFCQVAGPSWGARAGVLSLATPAAIGRVQVTLDCSVVS